MAGSIDLFGGDKSISGANLFRVDKSPLDQLDTGLSNMVGWDRNGQAADEIAQGFQDFIEKLWQEFLAMLENLLNLPFSQGLTAFLIAILDGIKKLGLDWVTQFEALTGLNIDEGPVKFLESLIALLGFDGNGIAKALQDLIDGIIALFGGVGKDVAAAIAAIRNWLDNVFKPIADGLAEAVGWLQTFFDGIIALFGGSGAGVTDALNALSKWLTTIFGPVSDGLEAIVKMFNDFIKSITGLFGGTGTTVADAIAAMTGWFTNFQKLLDALFSLFGGTTGTNKSITEVITAITGWFNGVFKKLIDGINGLANFIPGFTAGTNSIQNAIDIITGILGIGQAAQASAAQANLGVAAIIAGQNGGGSDEFDYGAAASLPSPWVSTYSGNATSTLGPDGRGYAVWKIGGAALSSREVHYRRSDVTLGKADCLISLGISKPMDDLINEDPAFWIEALWAADGSRFRVKVEPGRAQFESVSSTGTVTNVGAQKTVVTAKAGDIWALKIQGTTASLICDTVTQATQTISTTSYAGRQFGFGALQPGFIGLNHPAPEFTGIAWQ